jgi:hypothetical protein
MPLREKDMYTQKKEASFSEKETPFREKEMTAMIVIARREATKQSRNTHPWIASSLRSSQ